MSVIAALVIAFFAGGCVAIMFTGMAIASKIRHADISDSDKAFVCEVIGMGL